MPSPTIATLRLLLRSSLTHFAFCSGRSSPTASSTPRSRPTDEVTACVSPLSRTVFKPICRIAATAFLASGRRTSAMRMLPRSLHHRAQRKLSDAPSAPLLVDGQAPSSCRVREERETTD